MLVITRWYYWRDDHPLWWESQWCFGMLRTWPHGSNDSKRRPQTIERKRTLPTTWFPRTLPTSACPISARTENKTRAEGFLSEAEKHHRAPRPFDCTFQHWNPPFSDLSWSEDILSKMVLGYPSITHKSISLSEFKRQNELKWISSLPWVRRYSVHKVRTGNHSNDRLNDLWAKHISAQQSNSLQTREQFHRAMCVPQCVSLHLLCLCTFPQLQNNMDFVGGWAPYKGDTLVIPDHYLRQGKQKQISLKSMAVPAKAKIKQCCRWCFLVFQLAICARRQSAYHQESQKLRRYKLSTVYTYTIGYGSKRL